MAVVVLLVLLPPGPPVAVAGLAVAPPPPPKPVTEGVDPAVELGLPAVFIETGYPALEHWLSKPNDRSSSEKVYW